MIKILTTILCSFFIFEALPLSTGTIFQSEYLRSEQILLQEYLHSSSLPSPLLANAISQTVLQDPKNLITNDFAIPDYFEDAVAFWFSIYTQFDSGQMVIHDRTELSLIYDILDFTELSQSPLNTFVQSSLKSQYADDKIRLIRNTLIQLSQKPYHRDGASIKIHKIIAKSRLKIPKGHRSLRKFYFSLAQNIRVQTGQRNMIFTGIINSLPYLKFFNHYLKLLKLPDELIALPFVESSFNPHAVSSVGASGAWQIMPQLANKLLPFNKQVDGRSNIVLSSIAAMHLLKQNFMVLKRWDMAVTAYNSGTKHLIRAKKKFKHLKNLTLSDIFTRYQHPHLGFASVNFYAEFLALAYILKYKDMIFPLKGTYSDLIESTDIISIFVAVCPFAPNDIFAKIENLSPETRLFNRHFKHPEQSHPRGSLIVSSMNLESYGFKKVSSKTIVSEYPRNWKNIIKDYKCSIK